MVELYRWMVNWPPGLQAAVVLGAAACLGLVLHWILFRTIAGLGRRVPGVLVFDGALLRHSRSPTRLLFPLIALYIVLPSVIRFLPEDVEQPIRRVGAILLIVAIAWLLIRVLRVIEDVVTRRFDLGMADNLRARKVRTQTEILRRVLSVVIAVLALAAVLMQFEEFRALGTGLLASAGVVGVIVGVAAQRPISNLLAGFQIAITQPIRVDDVVIVEDEWGKIEEITLTYVVVRIWDLRRLVLPISYFVEKPFQNWTRTSAELLGVVFLYVDYSVPVDALRAELLRIVQQSEYWNGQVCKIQVTDATESTMQLRALVSAADAGLSWELRCEVREKLIDFIQQHYPDSLPRVRAEVASRVDGDRSDGGPAERDEVPSRLKGGSPA